MNPSFSAARFIRSHGIAAWPTADRDMVLAMATSVESTPHGPIIRSKPVLLVSNRREVAEWLGY